MKRIAIILLLTAVIGGCAFGQDKAKRLLIDSDYEKYNQSEDELERAYLNDEITYLEYHEGMERLRQDRLRSEQERKDILFGD